MKIVFELPYIEMRSVLQRLCKISQVLHRNTFDHD